MTAFERFSAWRVFKSPVPTRLAAMTIITDERCTSYSSPGHPERPARVSGTLQKLRAQTELPLKWVAPLDVTDEQILRAHTKQHVAHVKSATEAFDGDTPAHPYIDE